MKTRNVLLLITTFMLTSCAVGQYHLGYHNLGTDKYGYGAVGDKYVQDLEPFEVACVDKIVNYKINEMYEHFAPTIKEKLKPEQLVKLNNTLKDRYTYNGKYRRLLLVQQKSMLDEGVMKDAFKFYDFVGAAYLLEGNVNSVVKLYIYKIDSKLKLIGFEFMDYEKNPHGENNPVIRYTYPETIDNANLRNRYHKKIR